MHYGQGMMRVQQRYQVRRGSKRNFLHAAAEVRSTAVAGVHVAVVRDISESGLFIYSDFNPPVGTLLRITVKPSFFGSMAASFYCEGEVVRVEQPRPTAAPGIALRLKHKLPPVYIANLENAHLRNHQPQSSLSA
jgi:hypothetical protein